MNEVEISFGEGREGIVPVDTYLVDAAKRMGAAPFECYEAEGHQCKIAITSGSKLLSDPIAAEIEKLSDEELKQGIRLACYTKIEKPGVIKAMVDKKKKEETDAKAAEDREEAYRKEFSELPLEKKIANLMHLEAIALGETFAFVINSPFKVFEKVGDVMAEFGFKKEEDQKRRARPADAADENKASNGRKKKDEKAAASVETEPGT